jgi:hypothetical protein
MWLRKYGFSRHPFYEGEGGNGGAGGANSAGNNGGSAGGTGTGASGDTGAASGANSSTGGEDKKFSQADVDKIVNERLAREKKAHEKKLNDLKAQIDGAGDGAGTGTNQNGNQNNQGQNNQQGDAATAQVTAAMALANQKMVQATAIAEAVKLGVDPKYTTDVVKLCDLSKIEVKEDGSMDSNAIDAAINEVLKRVPVFKMTTDNSGGFRVGGTGGQNNQQNQNNNGWVNNQQGQNQGNKPWNRTNRQW